MGTKDKEKGIGSNWMDRQKRLGKRELVEGWKETEVRGRLKVGKKEKGGG